MELREFLDAANRLRFIDKHEFDSALPIPMRVSRGDDLWDAFLRDPVRWLARQPDDVAARVWQIAQAGAAPPDKARNSPTRSFSARGEGG